MNLDQNFRWRSRVGLAGTIFGLLFLISAVDGLSVHFREQGYVINVLADRKVKINGALRQEIKDPDELTYVSNCPDIWLKFEKIHTGFWLGGLMWRGQLVVDRKAVPGDYLLSVFRKFAPDERPLSTFSIKVYATEAALRQNSKSFLERYLGVSPWRVFALGLVCSLVSFGLAYYLSNQRERLLAKEGKAEIFRIIETSEGREVHFSLGSKDGVRSDSRLLLLDDKGNYLSTLQVKLVTETDSSANVDQKQGVKLGYIVALDRSIQAGT